MPKNFENLETVQVSLSGNLPDVDPDLSLEAKLQVAREKRKIALSARAAEAEKLKKRRSQNPVVRIFARVEEWISTITRSRRASLPFGAGAWLVAIFLGAFGFGLGVSLGVLALSASLELAFVPNTNRQEIAQRTETTVETGMVWSEQERKLDAAPTLGATAISQTRFQHLNLPELTIQSTPTLPEITKVRYLSGDAHTPERLVIDDVRGALPTRFMLLPDGVVRPNVFLHAPDGISDRSLQAYVDELEKSGLLVARIGREALRVSETHIRYYSYAAKPDALAISELLGIEARDFTSADFSSRRIEIWVQGAPSLYTQNGDERRNRFTGLLQRREPER